MRYACSVCGKSSGEKRCPTHRRAGNTSWAGNRDRAAQHRFRQAVLTRDGERCTYVDPETGQRCVRRHDLRAAHTKPLRDFVADDPGAYDPMNGLTLCAKHDRLTDSHAR